MSRSLLAHTRRCNNPRESCSRVDGFGFWTDHWSTCHLFLALGTFSDTKRRFGRHHVYGVGIWVAAFLNFPAEGCHSSTADGCSTGQFALSLTGTYLVDTPDQTQLCPRPATHQHDLSFLFYHSPQPFDDIALCATTTASSLALRSYPVAQSKSALDPRVR